MTTAINDTDARAAVGEPRHLRGRLESAPRPPQDANVDTRVTRMEAILPNLATKADLETLRVSLAHLQGELKAEFERGQKESRTWMVATVLGLFVSVLGLGNFVAAGLQSRLDTQPQARAQLPPIVIQLPASAMAASTLPAASAQP